MKHPQAVIDAVRGAMTGQTEVKEQVRRAVAAVRRLPGFDEYVEGLVNDAIQGLVYNLRHTVTVGAKREAKAYGGAGKVLGPHESPSTAAALASFYDSFSIGGTCIGNLTFEDLEPLESEERNAATGRLANAEMIAWLRKKVKPGQTVRQAVSEKALKDKWASIQNAKEKSAA